MFYHALNILKDDCELALVLLNQPLKVDLLKILWKRAFVTVAADGAADRLYDALHETDRHLFIPHFIAGDMDSSTDFIRKFYQTKGSNIVKVPDQDSTDFFKSLSAIMTKVNQNATCRCVAVMGAVGGRLDHTLSSIHYLYRSLDLFPSVPVYLFSDDSLSLLLPQGEHEINLNSGFEDDWCGLIPVGHPCQSVTTSGLKWNLKKQKMEFGGLISTSNTYDGSAVVKVCTDQNILWTMGFKL